MRLETPSHPLYQCLTVEQLTACPLIDQTLIRTIFSCFLIGHYAAYLSPHGRGDQYPNHGCLAAAAPLHTELPIVGEQPLPGRLAAEVRDRDTGVQIKAGQIRLHGHIPL